MSVKYCSRDVLVCIKQNPVPSGIYALYSAGVVVILLWMVIPLGKISVLLMMTSPFFFGLGFCVDAFPMVCRLYDNKFIWRIGVPVHALIVLLASIPAKIILSKSFNLPPGDFKVTFGLWGVFCFVYIYIMIVSLLLCFGGVIFFIMSLLRKKSSVASEWGRKFKGYLTASRSIGAFMAALSFIYIGDRLDKIIELPRWSRLFAYYADYDSASEYPRVVHIDGVKFKLHDNGVVSYARRSNRGGIEICVTYIDKPLCDFKSK